MYKLTKLAIEEGKTSAVRNGYSTSGNTFALFKAGLDGGPKEIFNSPTLLDVDEGWQVFVASFGAWHNTSPIKEILSKEDDKVMFRTQTSLYELLKLQEKD